MRLITNTELQTSTLKAIEEGTILGLGPGWYKGCFYRAEVNGKEYNCAVGSALTKEERDTIEANGLNEMTVFGLKDSALSPVSFEDVEYAQRLQRAHDRITSIGLDFEEKSKRVREFKEFLERDPKNWRTDDDYEVY